MQVVQMLCCSYYVYDSDHPSPSEVMGVSHCLPHTYEAHVDVCNEFLISFTYWLSLLQTLDTILL